MLKERDLSKNAQLRIYNTILYPRTTWNKNSSIIKKGKRKAKITVN